MRIKKTIHTLLISILFILLIVGCKDVPRKPGAEMVFDKEAYDFGQIEQGEVVTHVFNFENIGADTLEIARVFSS